MDLGFLELDNFGSAIAHLLGCFCLKTFLWNFSLYMLSSDSFMSNLYSKLGYPTGEFQALQLVVIALFGAVD